MALEFMCLLDEAKTARLYQRKIVKLVNKMFNESTDPDAHTPLYVLTSNLLLTRFLVYFGHGIISLLCGVEASAMQFRLVDIVFMAKLRRKNDWKVKLTRKKTTLPVTSDSCVQVKY
ncbi:hypothetical protein EDC96DRAFT_550012 [Choanephora cucurbitarum]|nr:hypothetical protein EDC96DRAFT_550012 [Choanephora cucurbitarum]